MNREQLIQLRWLLKRWSENRDEENDNEMQRGWEAQNIVGMIDNEINEKENGE